MKCVELKVMESKERSMAAPTSPLVQRGCSRSFTAGSQTASRHPHSRSQLRRQIIDFTRKQFLEQCVTHTAARSGWVQHGTASRPRPRPIKLSPLWTQSSPTQWTSKPGKSKSVKPSRAESQTCLSCSPSLVVLCRCRAPPHHILLACL